MQMRGLVSDELAQQTKGQYPTLLFHEVLVDRGQEVLRVLAALLPILKCTESYLGSLLPKRKQNKP
jgi:hypothetical protein